MGNNFCNTMPFQFLYWQLIFAHSCYSTQVKGLPELHTTCTQPHAITLEDSLPQHGRPFTRLAGGATELFRTTGKSLPSFATPTVYRWASLSVMSGLFFEMVLANRVLCAHSTANPTA